MSAGTLLLEARPDPAVRSALRALLVLFVDRFLAEAKAGR